MKKQEDYQPNNAQRIKCMKKFGMTYIQKSQQVLLLRKLGWKEVSELMDMVLNSSSMGRSFYQFWREQSSNELSSMVYLNLPLHIQNIIQDDILHKIQDYLTGTTEQISVMLRQIKNYTQRIKNHDIQVFKQRKRQYLVNLKGQKILTYLGIIKEFQIFQNDLATSYTYVARLFCLCDHCSVNKQLLKQVRSLMKSMWKVNTTNMTKEELKELLDEKEYRYNQKRRSAYQFYLQLRYANQLPYDIQKKKESFQNNKQNWNVFCQDKQNMKNQEYHDQIDGQEISEQENQYSQELTEEEEFIFKTLKKSTLEQVQCLLQIQANRKIRQADPIIEQDLQKWNLKCKLIRMMGTVKQKQVQNLIIAYKWTSLRLNISYEYHQISYRYLNNMLRKTKYLINNQNRIIKNRQIQHITKTV